MGQKHLVDHFFPFLFSIFTTTRSYIDSPVKKGERSVKADVSR